MINRAFQALLDFINNHAVIRRTVMLTTLWMTIRITFDAWAFAHSSPFDGVGTAAVIAAVTTPFAALQAFAFKTYTDGRSE